MKSEYKPSPLQIGMEVIVIPWGVAVNGNGLAGLKRLLFIVAQGVLRRI